MKQLRPMESTPAGKDQRQPVIRSVPALSRGIAVLRLLAASEAPLGVHDIARALRLVPSTCLHILRVLARERLIVMDLSTKKYATSAGLAALARAALRHSAFPSVVQLDLDELSAAHGVTAIAVEASGLDHMIVVALARSPSPLQLQVDIGSRFPALISATGRCIAAFGDHPWAEVKARFRTLKWDAPPTIAEWQAEVQATRDAGFAIDDGRYIRGISVVAAPVGMPGGAVNALVAVGLSDRMRELGLIRLGHDLRGRAARVSATLQDGTPSGRFTPNPDVPASRSAPGGR